MSDENGGGGVFTALIIGAAIGYALGLMFAPQKGEKTRKLVYDKSLEYGKEAQKYAGIITEKVKEEIEKRFPPKEEAK